MGANNALNWYESHREYLCDHLLYLEEMRKCNRREWDSKCQLNLDKTIAELVSIQCSVPLSKKIKKIIDREIKKKIGG